MCGAPGRQGQTVTRALSTKGNSTSLPPPRRSHSACPTFFMLAWCREGDMGDCYRRGSQRAPDTYLRRTGPQGGPFLDSAQSPSVITGWGCGQYTTPIFEATRGRVLYVFPSVAAFDLRAGPTRGYPGLWCESEVHIEGRRRHSETLVATVRRGSEWLDALIVDLWTALRNHVDWTFEFDGIHN